MLAIRGSYAMVEMPPQSELWGGRAGQVLLKELFSDGPPDWDHKCRLPAVTVDKMLSLTWKA